MTTIVKPHWTDAAAPKLRQQLQPGQLSAAPAKLSSRRQLAKLYIGRVTNRKERLLMKTADGSLFYQPLSTADWSTDHTHARARTPTSTRRRGAVDVEPALIWLGSCLLLSCLVVYEFCSAVYSPTPASPLSAPTSHNTAFHLSRQICKFRSIIFGKVLNLRLYRLTCSI